MGSICSEALPRPLYPCFVVLVAMRRPFRSRRMVKPGSTALRSAERFTRIEKRMECRSLRKAVDPGFTIRLERDGRLIAINTTKQGYGGRGKVSLQIEPILY